MLNAQCLLIAGAESALQPARMYDFHQVYDHDFLYSIFPLYHFHPGQIRMSESCKNVRVSIVQDSAEMISMLSHEWLVSCKYVFFNLNIQHEDYY